MLDPTEHSKLGEHNVRAMAKGPNGSLLKRKAIREGCVMSSLSEVPAKRPTVSGNVGNLSPTAEAWPLRIKNEPPCTDAAGHANLGGLCSSGSSDLNCQKINSTAAFEPTLQKNVWNVGRKETFSIHGSSQMGVSDTLTQATTVPHENHPCGSYSPVRQAQDTTYSIRASILPPIASPDLADPFFPYQSQVPSTDGNANLNRVPLTLMDKGHPAFDEQPSPESWSQECPGLQRPSLTAPEAASTASESGISGIEFCMQGAERKLGKGLGNTSVVQVEAGDSRSAEYDESILMRRVKMDTANPLSLLNEIRLGPAGAIAGRSHCVARLFDCLDPMQDDALGMVNMGPNAGGFSFQRLISGDITGFEHEFEEDSDEDCGEKDVDIEEEAEEEDSDMYSAVYTPSGPLLHQDFELGVCTSDSESQHSDDMYYRQRGISKHSPLERGWSANLDSEIHELPLGVVESASCSRPQKLHVGPCLLPKVDAGWQQQTSSDSSRDLYSEGITSCSSKQCHGSPCLHPTIEAYRPVLPDASWDPCSEGCEFLSRQQQAQGSPCLHPISNLGWQSSSATSEGLSLRPGLCRTNRLKEEAAVSSAHKETLRERPRYAEEGMIIDVPGTAKALLSSGLVDGYPVSYQAKGGGVLLTGIVKNGGILCNCRVCKGGTVVNVSCFEKHAGSTARHPSENIFFENGKSLQDVLRAGWHSSDGKFASAVRSAVRNNINDGISDKDFNNSNSATRSHRKHRFDFNVSRNGQTLPPSQTRDMNKLLFLPGGLPDGTEVAYYIRGQRVLTGTKKGHGIHCSCCNEVISCSLFEAHAGWGSRRNPYNSIFLPDGQSLHKFAQSLAVKVQENVAVETSRDNDDLCAECGDGGDLVLCDDCPGAYHAECLGLASIPEGDWFCPLCEGKVEHAKHSREQWSEKSLPPCGGQLRGITAKKKGLERCQCVVRASKNSIGGCVICKSGDFLKTGFGAKTVLLCDQCEREFHVGCLKEEGIVDLQELPAGEWFCGVACTRIHKVLEELVLRGPKPVCSSICNAVLEMKQHEERQQELKPQNSEFTWQLLHGRRGDPENGKVLSEAATIFTESFDPIVDASSGRDLISLMVHSRRIRDQDFGGMYCAVLKWKQTIVSTAIIRIFGRRLAEMPLVATSATYRGQGFFQMLILNIEQLLGMLQVQHLVLPATGEAEGIWTRKLGFSKLEDEQVQQFESEVQIMMFQGSSMLLKSIPQQPSQP
eukprot:c7702_g1_i1 orf=637-4326(-)